MIIELTKFLDAVSHAMDYVEDEVLDVPAYHVKRVAVLTHRMALHMGIEKDQLFALTQAAVLHDCALSEYLEDESAARAKELNMSRHCIAGEQMMKKFPFYKEIKGAVLYHHDRADGQGAMGMREEETPLCAQLIHIADQADTNFQLDSMDPEKYEDLRRWIHAEGGTRFSKTCSQLFLDAIDYDLLMSITGTNCIRTLEDILPDVSIDIPISLLRDMSMIFADITDYKSHFTWRHSLGIAEKAEKIGHYYGYPQELCDKLYIAGALHDIGKLLISNDILEKPGKLTSEEYREITNHAMGTWKLLYPIGGMEDITRWAALHHEKLDGSGYPFGYTKAMLGKHERLMACLDIYQALVEERPYKAGLSHDEAMKILRKMGDAGQLDTDIIDDISSCYREHKNASATGDASGEQGTSGTAGEASVPSRSGTGDSAPAQSYFGEAWRCPVCGYVHEGSLPPDLICPQCEQPGSIFEQIS